MSYKLSLRLAWYFGLAIGLFALLTQASAQSNSHPHVDSDKGFDDLTQPNWLMVPQYGNNFVQVISPASPTFPLSFFIKPESNVEWVAPTPTRISPQTITVHGETKGDAHQVAFGVGPMVGQGAELHLSIKALQTVKVALHQIILQKGNTYGPSPNAPTAAQAQSYLNQVYGLQTNTYFTVTRRDYALAYDVGGLGATVNDKLDLTAIPPYTAEQMVIENSDAKDYGVYNIYFVHDYADQQGPNSVGHALSRLNSAYIKDYSGRTAVVTVLAHELGHLLGITFHADLDLSFNPGYLKGTDPTVRLMHSTINGPVDNPKVLIKAEWDLVNHL